MTAPQGGNFPQKEKRTDIQEIQPGFHPVYLFGIVDLGTQESTYQNKVSKTHKIKFLFEFPLHKQLFYVEDTEPRPSTLTVEKPFHMYVTKNNNKKTGLLTMVESMIGRMLSPQEYGTFDISSLIGKYYIASVSHWTSKSGKIGAEIAALGPFQPEHYANQLNSGQLNPTNPIKLFSLAMGFESPAFASLWYGDRKKLKMSDEGMAWAARGGKFVKFDQTGQNLEWDDAPMQVNQSANTPQQHYQQNVQQPAQQAYQQAPAQQYQQPQGQPAQMPQQGYGQQAPQQQAQQAYGQPQAQSPAAQFMNGTPQSPGAPQQAQQQMPQQQPGGASPQQFQQPQQQAQQPTTPVGPPVGAGTPAGFAQPANTPAQYNNAQAPAGGQQMSAFGAPPAQQAGAPMQQQGQAPGFAPTNNFREEEHDDLPF